MVLGAGTAVVANRFPRHELRLEQGAGALFVLGLILIGFGFPLI